MKSSLQADSTDDRDVLALAVLDACVGPLSARRSGVGALVVDAHPKLIQEDQIPGVQLTQLLTILLTQCVDPVGVALSGAQSFFFESDPVYPERGVRQRR